MPRTKSLAALIEQYGDDRGYKPNSNKIPMVYKILNRQIFKNQLKKMPKIMVRRMHGALGLFEFNPCLLYTSPSPRDISGSRMPSSA